MRKMSGLQKMFRSTLTAVMDEPVETKDGFNVFPALPVAPGA